MNMKDLKTKLTSRKFLVAVAGIVSGVVLIAGGSTAEGATMIATSVVAYLAAEGIIDMAAVKNAADDMDDIDFME
ncbi:MAG: hypothetical protein IJX64_05300 [Clostridia bacterium]|nr:hypothetical protein [Clostridia bacterium]